MSTDGNEFADTSSSSSSTTGCFLHLPFIFNSPDRLQAGRRVTCRHVSMLTVDFHRRRQICRRCIENCCIDQRNFSISSAAICKFTIYFVVCAVICAIARVGTWLGLSRRIIRKCCTYILYMECPSHILSIAITVF